MIRVLVIDDAAELLTTVRENLSERGGFEIATAQNEEAALAAVRAGGIDAIVLDFQLGVARTGRDVLREIRRIDRLVPVLLYSGVFTGEDKADLVHEGVSFMLEKGTRPEALPEALQHLASQRDEIISSLEAWAEDNPAAGRPRLRAGGRAYSMNEALVQMRAGTSLGRELLDQYRQGAAQVVSSRGRDEADNE